MAAPHPTADRIFYFCQDVISLLLSSQRQCTYILPKRAHSIWRTSMLSALFDFLESEFGLNNLSVTSTRRHLPPVGSLIPLDLWNCASSVSTKLWVNMWIVSVWGPHKTRSSSACADTCRKRKLAIQSISARTELRFPFTWENHNTLVETIQNFFPEEKTCSGICRLLALA